MYPQHLKEFSKAIFKLRGKSDITFFCNHKPALVDEIKYATRFLSEPYSIVARAFCVLNNIIKKPTCRTCDNFVIWESSRRTFRTHCSKTCFNSDFKETDKKRKQTCLDKYGVEHHWQSKEIQNKQKQTMLERYGVEHNSLSKELREEAKIGLLKKYGVEHNWQIPSVQKTRRETWTKRYGVDNPLKNSSIVEKLRKTSIERYGVKNPRQRHLSKTCIKRLNDYNWLYEQYYIKKRTVVDIAAELEIDNTSLAIHLRKFGFIIVHIRAFSFKAIQWLEFIMKEQKIYIQHAQNGGEYRIPDTRLYADGYCKDNNTIYEFYGDLFHGNPVLFESHEKCHPFNDEIMAGELCSRTREREDLIRSLGYNLMTMWESEWDKIDKA